MSAPRTKRLFAGASADPSQRQITSFFNPRAPGELSPSTIDESRRLSSALPAGIQSNLINVGMRVRKSVPEGYKTGGTSAFKLWTDNTPAVGTSAARSAPAKCVSQRELMPFCGINEVGGLESQPAFSLHRDFDDDMVPSLDDVPGLTLSQESVESNISSTPSEPNRKRIFDDGEDEEIVVPAAQIYDEEISPRSLAPMGWRNARVMAVPHSRVRKPGVAAVGIGQENVAMDEDFEEAEFLVFEGKEEMDMSG